MRAQQASTFIVPDNAVYVEFLGRTGDRLSINYERVIYRVYDRYTFLARVGTFYMEQRDARSWDVEQKTGDLILGLSTVYRAQGRNRLETGIGLNMQWYNSAVFGYSARELLTASIGYRLLPKNGKGLMIRANAELTGNAAYNWLEYYLEGDLIQDEVMPWIAVAVGYAF